MNLFGKDLNPIFEDLDLDLDLLIFEDLDLDLSKSDQKDLKILFSIFIPD